MPMELELGLYTTQSQRLVMTTQMRQAITILQCSAWELYELLQREAEVNPWLEVDPPSPPLAAWLRWRDAAGSERGTEQREPFPIEQRIAAAKRVADDLEMQVRCMRAPSDVTRIACKLIGMLDESGYLREPPDALAAWLGVSRDTVESAIRLLQSCDPPGIAARDLRECLLLQMGLVPDEVRDMARRMVEAHLEDLAAQRLPKIARSLNVPVEAVQRAADAIRRLNPRPAAGLDGERPVYVVPDLVVERDGERLWVRTHDRAEPRLRMTVPDPVRLQEADPQAREWLDRRWRQLQWLVRSIEQRRLTLLRVAEVVVARQRRFFVKGFAALRPLTMRQVAEELGIHESTVSRAVRGKWMQTPRGLVELRALFSAELPAHPGDTSAAVAKHYIRELVAGEEPTRPLSDDAIARRLADEGIHISRRTVAKYREELRIPPSHRRRRYTGK
jgi:RNA polymerase sigma-54 factor